MIDTWLKIGAIGIPLVGVAILSIWRGKLHQVQYRLASIILGVVALIAMALFLHNRLYACIVLLGRQNCLFEGLATLSLFLLNLILARACAVPWDINKGYDIILMLLLSSAWAGIGLAENLFVILLSFYLFFFVFNRWIKREGFKGGFLMLRDDYEEEQKYYQKVKK